MFTVYVIRSAEGLSYVGQTQNIEKRLQEHNSGLSFWTSRGTNWVLAYSEQVDKRADAMRREKFLKTGKGREFLDTVTHMDL